jgi:hypothetical protein
LLPVVPTVRPATASQLAWFTVQTGAVQFAPEQLVREPMSIPIGTGS